MRKEIFKLIYELSALFGNIFGALGDYCFGKYVMCVTKNNTPESYVLLERYKHYLMLQVELMRFDLELKGMLRKEPDNENT